MHSGLPKASPPNRDTLMRHYSLLALLLATLSTPALANADASSTAAESTDETQVPDSPWTGSGELGYASARGNSTSESFNGRLRDECLNETLFTSLAHARFVLDAWRYDYNHVRPHSKLGGRTPAEIAGQRVRGHAPAHVAINSNNHHEGAGLYL